MIQSLDELPIHQSKRIFISLAARSVPKTTEKLPFFSEPVEGELKIKAIEGLKLTKQGSDKQSQLVKSTYKDGYYFITLDKTLQTYWLTLSESIE